MARIIDNLRIDYAPRIITGDTIVHGEARGSRKLKNNAAASAIICTKISFYALFRDWLHSIPPASIIRVVYLAKKKDEMER